MKRHALQFIAITLLFGCGGSAPEPDPAPVETPAPTSEPVEDSAATRAAESGNELEYHWREGRTRAYLPPTSSVCQEDELASPSYAVSSLLQYDASTSEWTVVDVNSSGRWRISCNAMLDLIDVFGFDLKPGVYAIVASLDGLPEHEIFTVGEDQCEGPRAPAPAGKVSACVGGNIRMLPAPAGWEN